MDRSVSGSRMILALAVAAVLLVEHGSPVGATQGGDWTTEEVAQNVFAGPQIAVGPDGAPHALFVDCTVVTKMGFVYAWREEGRWRTDRLPGARGAAGQGAIAVDDTGAAHVVFELDGALTYAKRDGDGWRTRPMGPRYDRNYYFGLSLALDKDGGPHVAAADPWSVTHWVLDGSKWLSSALDRDIGGTTPTSIAIDDGGFVHVAYRSWKRGVVVAEQTMWGWTSTVVDPVVKGQTVTLAAAADGAVHLVYDDPLDGVGAGLLHYAVRTGARWTSWELDGAGRSVLGRIGLALTAQGTPHIVFVSNGRAMHASRMDGEWRAEELPVEEGASGDGIDFELDGGGRAHLAFLRPAAARSAGRTLIYATGVLPEVSPPPTETSAATETPLATATMAATPTETGLPTTPPVDPSPTPEPSAIATEQAESTPADKPARSVYLPLLRR